MAKVKDDLKRNVSGFNAYTMVVGTIIGTGIFFKPQAVFSATGTASLGLIVWVIGCVLGMCGGLIVAEIGTLIPETGGLMTYLEKIYSPVLGFMVGWSQMICFYPIRIAAGAVVFGTQASALLGFDDSTIPIISVVVVLIINLVNGLGNKATGILQDVSTFLKFVPIILIIFVGLFINPDPVSVRLLPITIESHPLMGGLALGIIATLYATDGWINVTNIAGEVKDPNKNIPRALIAGITTVMVAYLAINIAYLKVMTPAQLAGTNTPAADVANLLFGNIGGKLITIGIMVSVFGSQTGFTRASWRVPYALALRNTIPFSSWFSKLSKKTEMPINSGLFIMTMTISCILFIGNYNALTDIGSFVIWFFYTLTFAGLFILRKKWPDKERPYKVPLYPVVPILGILGGLFILGSTIVFQPIIALWAIGLPLTGVPVYLYKNKKIGGVVVETLNDVPSIDSEGK